MKLVKCIMKNIDNKTRTELIRAGNKYFNENEFDKAEKCFITAGYKDGLHRLGDYYYYDCKKPLVALKYYEKAGIKDKIDEIYERMSKALKSLMDD